MSDYFTDENLHKLSDMLMQERGKRIVRASIGKPQDNYRKDGYMNVLTKYGTQQDNATAYQFVKESITADMQLAQQYEADGLFARIIDLPAEEAVKHGFDLGLTSPEAQTCINDKLDNLNWEEKAATAIKWARLFGGAIIVMLIDDGRGIDEPLDWQNIASIDELLVYDRSIVTPDEAHLYSFMPQEMFGKWRPRLGEPEFYQVSSIYGTFVAHASRCLVFRNGILPERTMQANYRYFGMPEYERIKKELRQVVTSHGLGVKLLERCVQAVYSMRNLAQMLATEDGENQVLKRLQIIDMARSILNSIAIDGEGESYEFKSMPLSGVKDVLDSTCNMLSAVTNIPQTLLFGRSPAGENATGASDLENYYNYVERIQKMMLRSNLTTLIDVIVQASLAGNKIQDEPDYKLTFNPLWSLSETEQATVEQTKAATALTKAQTAQIYVDMQALDPSEVRAGLAKDDDFQVEELLDDLSEDELWGLEKEDLSLEEEAVSDFSDQQQLTAENHLTTEQPKVRMNDSIPTTDGGAGSGNFGHEGRSGKVGGSGKGTFTKRQYEKSLIGKQTSDGKTVKAIHPHAMKRMLGRDVYPHSVERAITKPERTIPGNTGNRTIYIAKGTYVVYDNDNEDIRTVIYKGKGGK